ncbi:DUF6093 family protein [Streptomyces sp. NPDC000070]|uniref:DUF6093 family protein n=1 Tax=Streptomyces sp. NPDC000070 TaxID=3154240 RepID=UPI0033279D71
MTSQTRSDGDSHSHIETAPAVTLITKAPELRPDDVIRVAGSVRPGGPRDPQLVGRSFRASDETVGTYSVVRIVRVKVIDRPRPPPNPGDQRKAVLHPAKGS